jgi:hypothetical protein
MKDETTMNGTTKNLLHLARSRDVFRSALATQLHFVAPRDFAIDPGAQEAMLRGLVENDAVRVTYWLKGDDEPERNQEVVVLSAWDPTIPGVEIQTAEGSGTGLLVDGGPDEGVLYQPSVRGPSYPIRRMSLVQSRLAAEKKAAAQIFDHMGGMRRLASVLGANNFRSAGAAVSFEWPAPAGPKGNKVRLARMPSGDFAVCFLSRTASGEQQVGRYRDVPAARLVELFEQQTGWTLGL